ncbi:isoamylase 2, chloroplastic-like [Neltuma alba]|uniref:isoamylase 2, chloroplastic n=1 Tax=Neltuma alba TaxID=207710 RepID=UPI0010A52FCA|nr:isoamylase 2, chloroplastic-like [Prosopis alba]XP_028787574.1 isoamylase 2, chloroplastic-like [Prosopis alba]XP_028787575.1 isoamylase 2, chloroplastic-like [Prosopis alba]XP_028787576.1 isoamylase 2, chloroplastic-like [Prosopis alba]XP_028787577.1 isoamylase 2, chloroplastic-like [Prosopis alba]
MANLPLSFSVQACLQKPKVIEASQLSECKGGSRLSRFEKSDTERKLVCRAPQSIVSPFYQNFTTKLCATPRVSIEGSKNQVTTFSEAEDLRRALSYLFRTENGGLVKVHVIKKNVKYSVHVEVSSLEVHGEGLVLCWGVYRANSSRFEVPDFKSSATDTKTGMNLSPFQQSLSGNFKIELEFDAKQVPFYFSFILRSSFNTESSASDVRSHRKTNFCVPVGSLPGHPAPLGLSFSPDGSMNFAIFSRQAEGMVLCLYDDTNLEKPALRLDLDHYVNRSGDIWHIAFESAWTFVSYGYHRKGALVEQNKDDNFNKHVLLDPYAKVIGNSFPNGYESGLTTKFLGRLCKEPDFDWGDDFHPNLPFEKLVVYRLNVELFTQHKSSQLPTGLAGTFAALAEKVQHFKDLGVNAVLLEPILSFDEQKGPYFPCHFFSPMHIFGPSGGPISTINSMKEMVKYLHANGIEVLMEVAVTRTADVGALQGIDDVSYYYANGVGDSKTQSSLNCNYPVVQQLILDSLRHWVTEFHIDGFSFINASHLLRGFHGEHLSRPPLVEAIAFDPLLSKTKIIADCWDPYDMVVRQTRFPHWMRWAEMNANFCNGVRNFLRGESLISDLATRLCGSGDLFSDRRGPAFSFNYVSRNFGLSLVDLVSFSREELASELSWNCGEEGPTNDKYVLERRLKQIRNFLFILFVSLGVPVLNMGDECGLSCGGSPAYGDRKPLDWSALNSGFGKQISEFILFLTRLRKRRSDIFQRRSFWKEENIQWRGSDLAPPKWKDPSCKFLALTLRVERGSLLVSSETSNLPAGDIFVAFNAADQSETVVLSPPPEGMSWCRLVDTSLPFPGFFSFNGEPVPVPEQPSELFAYEVKSHSCILLEATYLDS